MFLVMLALTFVLRFPAFFVPVFNSDETFLATQAHVIEQGGQLYEDAADRKPPLVPYVYAATFAFFGTSALWAVRFVAMVAVALTALLLTVEARRRYGDRAGWIAGLLFVMAMVAFAPQDGQAANFEVFMLPSMTAAILFARRGRGVAAGAMVAAATLAKQTGAATLLPVLYLLARARGKRGVGGVTLGFAVPIALVALAVGPAQLFYWAVLGNGSYLGVDTASALVVAMFGLMTLGWVACNLPLLWKIPQAWRDRDLPANDGRARHRPLAVAPVGARWRWRSVCGSSGTTTCSWCRHSPCSRRVRSSRASWRTRAATVAVAAVSAHDLLGRGLLHAPVRRRARVREGESLSRGERAHERLDPRVGQRARDLLGVGPASGHPVHHHAHVPRDNHPGRTQGTVAPAELDAQMWDYFYEDFLAHPPRYILDTSPAKMRGAEHSPISQLPDLPGHRRCRTTGTCGPSTASRSTSVARPDTDRLDTAPDNEPASKWRDYPPCLTPVRGVDQTSGQGVER